MNIEVSKHALERLKKRCGLNRKAAIATARKAFAEGVQHKDTRGRLNRYLSKLFLEYKTANNIRVHGLYIYLFCGHTLVTVLHVPNQLRKHVKPNI